MILKLFLIYLGGNMEKQNIYQEIKEILGELLREQGHWPECNSDIVPKDLELDSLQIVSLIILIEEKYGIIFEDEDLLFENYGSINSIVKLLSKYI